MSSSSHSQESVDFARIIREEIESRPMRTPMCLKQTPLIIPLSFRGRVDSKSVPTCVTRRNNPSYHSDLLSRGMLAVHGSPLPTLAVADCVADGGIVLVLVVVGLAHASRGVAGSVSGKSDAIADAIAVLKVADGAFAGRHAGGAAVVGAVGPQDDAVPVKVGDLADGQAADLGEEVVGSTGGVDGRDRGNLSHGLGDGLGGDDSGGSHSGGGLLESGGEAGQGDGDRLGGGGERRQRGDGNGRVLASEEHDTAADAPSLVGGGNSDGRADGSEAGGSRLGVGSGSARHSDGDGLGGGDVESLGGSLGLADDDSALLGGRDWLLRSG